MKNNSEIIQERMAKYLLKYKKDYKLKKDEGVYSIICKRGEIDLKSLDKHTLKYWHFQEYYGQEEIRCSKSFPYILIRLQEAKIPYTDGNLTITFEEKHLPQLENILRIRKKKKYSPEALFRMRQRIMNNPRMHESHGRVEL